jgi:hypothetical protein
LKVGNWHENIKKKLEIEKRFRPGNGVNNITENAEPKNRKLRIVFKFAKV